MLFFSFLNFFTAFFNTLVLAIKLEMSLGTILPNFLNFHPFFMAIKKNEYRDVSGYNLFFPKYF